MIQAQCQHHLTFPQRNRVDQRRLDLFRHQCIVILNQTNLRRHLQGDRARQLQIVNLLFEPIAGVGQIVCLLCVFRQAALLGGDHLRQILAANFLQLFLAR